MKDRRERGSVLAGSMWSYWPTRPLRVRRALLALASLADERPLSPSEYERRKAEILGENR